jgi:hypothetical protein
VAAVHACSYADEVAKTAALVAGSSGTGRYNAAYRETQKQSIASWWLRGQDPFGTDEGGKGVSPMIRL